MKRRGFLACLAGAAITPLVPAFPPRIGTLPGNFVAPASTNVMMGRVAVLMHQTLKDFPPTLSEGAVGDYLAKDWSVPQ